jgi:hypothetical protein
VGTYPTLAPPVYASEETVTDPVAAETFMGVVAPKLVTPVLVIVTVSVALAEVEIPVPPAIVNVLPSVIACGVPASPAAVNE